MLGTYVCMYESSGFCCRNVRQNIHLDEKRQGVFSSIKNIEVIQKIILHMKVSILQTLRANNLIKQILNSPLFLLNKGSLTFKCNNKYLLIAIITLFRT